MPPPQVHGTAHINIMGFPKRSFLSFVKKIMGTNTSSRREQKVQTSQLSEEPTQPPVQQEPDLPTIPASIPCHRTAAPTGGNLKAFKKKILKTPKPKKHVSFKIDIATCLETGQPVEPTPGTPENERSFYQRHKELKMLRRAMIPEPEEVLIPVPQTAQEIKWFDEMDQLVKMNRLLARKYKQFLRKQAMQSGAVDFIMSVVTEGGKCIGKIALLMTMYPNTHVGSYQGEERHHANMGGADTLIPCSQYLDPETSMSGSGYRLDSSSDSDSDNDDDDDDDLTADFYLLDEDEHFDEYQYVPTFKLEI
ncbi:Fc.00g024060.m01.CDS01 [Cosmosporella sp. VM-42]